MPYSARKSIGSKGNICAFSPIAASISRSGVPALAEITISAGSYKVIPDRADVDSASPDVDGRPRPTRVPPPTMLSDALRARASRTMSATSASVAGETTLMRFSRRAETPLRD